MGRAGSAGVRRATTRAPRVRDLRRGGLPLIRAAELVQRKRDGEELPADELAELVLAYARDEVPDYQLAAFCMAVFFRGLSPAETFALTDAMVRSGERLDLRSELGRKVVDKHSTGGVGDKTSLAVGPIVAACGVPVGKMSGRGLGHTGGTLDKLESIPGYRVELSHDEFVRTVRETGCAIIGQTADLVPADKKLYGLRDVTATVDQVSLIASSIMSKKIAGGADAVVLDVKVGDGAFMKTLEDARELAATMIEIGRRAGLEVVCELTDMDQPLGRAVGNALEVREALATVRGEGPPDFTELVLASCAHLLALSDLGVDRAEGRRRAEAAIADGSAVAAYERWIRAQGGNPDEAVLERAPVVREVAAAEEGVVARAGAIAIGRAALHLGAGRQTKDDTIDHAVGVVCLAKRGDRVERGRPLAEVHARDEAAAAVAEAEIRAAYAVSDAVPAEQPIVIETLTSLD
ncbi:MAG TPA: thymidine phosphorylase [Gaiellaceae bacterium]|nr:thymidine phosphorylase [Gaiellaceae bacterium]